MKHLILLFTAIISIIIIACNKENTESKAGNTPVLPAEVLDYNNPSNPNKFDTINNEIATLGRVLFYDKNLSINKSTSCGSCHKQHLGFSDNVAFSKGINVKATLRNTPPLSNIFSYYSFFWDKRSNDLEEMVLMPVQDHIEMGFKDLDQLIVNLKSQPYYAKLFEDAYGTAAIDQEKVAAALAEFLLSFSSFNTKYDRGMELNFQNFNSKELQGKNLFFGEAKCSSCHSGNMNGSNRAANIGLNKEYKDKGFGNVTGNSANNGQFKIPTLRNIALTAPYMHDGRFKSLEEVVEHYNSGIVQHENLDWRLTDLFDEDGNLSEGFRPGCWQEPPNGGTPIRLNLSEHEKSSLIAFLKTLTDHQYLNDERYSNPFVNKSFD